ncbi:PRC-barrel domain-containing protein [Rufibacter hautae]|uniref:DUF2382 domain-containing protein n=1 Tax=Rufibacter hautae TaxID=2595005 RepID=A0A5B6TA50_9BACT|nr:PRC and DUF2382 domain-containing protein [Rufibacter hautae]KAA3437066.1 DUF2382 domain-containing protein [Rufibacter hautae]
MERRDSSAASYHLKELGDSRFTVAKGDSDIRGWKVSDSSGNNLGKVKDLLCDPEALKVRYLIVDLGGNVLDLEPRDILIPIGLAELHEAEDVVMVPSITTVQLQALPVYDKHHLTPDIERAVQRIFVGEHVHGTAPARQPENADYYNNEHFNQNNLYRNRKPKNIIGLFSDAGRAERARQELLHSGFPEDAIEVTYRQEAAQGSNASSQFEQFFYSLFTNPEEASTYEAKMQNSNALIVVHAYSQDEANRAAHLLDNRRPPELDIQVEKADSDASVTEHTTPHTYNSNTTSIPVIEERTLGGNQEIDTIQTHAQRQTVDNYLKEDTQPREEQPLLERIPVDHPTNEADFKSFQEGYLELKEYAEVPIITKEAFVVEEITIGKDVEVREELIQETARKTEIQIEELRSDSAHERPHPNSNL